MPSLMRILLVLVLSCGLANADTIREALVSLCDPAKIATITAERGANTRVRKICYWLEMARKAGREPSSEMREVLSAGACIDPLWIPAWRMVSQGTEG